MRKDWFDFMFLIFTLIVGITMTSSVGIIIYTLH